MKHRLISAALGVMLCAGLCGCSGPAPTEETLIAPSAPMADSVTYVDMDGFWVPVSYVRDEEQRLTGDAGPYSMALDSLLHDAPPAKDLPQIAPPEGGVGLGSLASDGTWDFYRDRVEHRISFPTDPRPQEPDWQAYFQERLEKLHYDGPVLICESVRFSWDGLDAAFVTASNVAGRAWADDQPARQPENANPSLYVLSALFVQGNAPVEVYSQFYALPNGQNAPEGVTYGPCVSGELYLPCLTAMQYGLSGEVEAFPVLCNMNGELLVRDLVYRPGWRVADIDGDGASEVIVGISASSSLMRYCEVYDLAQGTAKKTLHLSLN